MTSNGSAAPVCPVSRSQTPPAMPGIRVPAIPRATDLPSLIAAVNAINMLMQQLLGPGFPGAAGNDALQQGSGGVADYPDWAQSGQQRETMTVYGSVDPNNSIRVSRDYQVTFNNMNSGGKFIWSWPIK